MTNKKSILVTGSHRSGSTWVGNMIAKSPEIVYIDEPFLPRAKRARRRDGICGAKFDKWFTYISDENESSYYTYFKKTSKLSYNFWEALPSVSGWSTAQAIMKDYLTFLGNRMNASRPLFKDPIAIFSAQWLAQNFDMDVIVMIRHPLAFVGSLKKANWHFPFSDLLNQPLLMRDRLSDFEDEIREFASSNRCIVEQGILLWRLIYYVVAKYRYFHQDWIFVRHEDLSKDPLKGFANLFQKLGLEYTENVKSSIEENSSHPSRNDNEVSALDIKRNTFDNLSTYKNRLTDLEIEKILNQTKDVAGLFYPAFGCPN